MTSLRFLEIDEYLEVASRTLMGRGDALQSALIWANLLGACTRSGQTTRSAISGNCSARLVSASAKSSLELVTSSRSLGSASVSDRIRSSINDSTAMFSHRSDSRVAPRVK